MDRDLFFSAQTVEHPTPQAFFDALHKEFGFNLDAAARGEDETKEAFRARQTVVFHAMRTRGKSREDAKKAALKLRRYRKNNKCPAFFDEARSAFRFKWRPTANVAGRVWCNPPYGRGIGRWLARARDQLNKRIADVVVFLLPVRSDTAWWHEHIWDEEHRRPRPGVQIRFHRGRLKFGTMTAGAPFPSVVVVMKRSKVDAAS